MKKLILLMSLSMIAVEPVPPPVIADSLRADYFYALNEANVAQANLRLIEERLRSSCKDTHQPSLNGKELACVPKPMPPSVAPPKP